MVEEPPRLVRFYRTPINVFGAYVDPGTAIGMMNVEMFDNGHVKIDAEFIREYRDFIYDGEISLSWRPIPSVPAIAQINEVDDHIILGEN